MKYNYRVYGIDIKSDIEINEFIEAKFENYDVEFILGNMPKEILNLKEEAREYYYSKNEVWFHIDNIASYYIANGDTVIVEPCEKCDETLLRVYLMCSCLGFIMLQREQVAIHGGVVAIAGNGVILTGDRGVGKSTLTTALRNIGYQFISDDVAATYFDEVPYVYPGFPYQKLCDDAMDPLGYERDGLSKIVGDEKIKYIVPAFDSFYGETVPLRAIVQLTVGDVDRVTIEELRGSEKLNKILKNVYREEFIRYMGGMSPIFIKKCIDIAKNIICYKLTRPKEGLTVNEQIKVLEEVFRDMRIEKEVV